MSFEHGTQNSETKMWSAEKWSQELRTSDTEGKLAFFNDVVTGTEALPSEELEHLVLVDVEIGGKKCDVYHWDQTENGQKKSGISHRVYVHIKN